jgi:hypothetical protein
MARSRQLDAKLMVAASTGPAANQRTWSCAPHGLHVSLGEAHFLAAAELPTPDVYLAAE